MSLKQKLCETYMEYINENYDIKSFDHLKEVFIFESEKIYNFIFSKLRSEILSKNPFLNSEQNSISMNLSQFLDKESDYMTKGNFT